MTDDGQQPLLPVPTASTADYTDLTRAELNGLKRQLDELAHRLARIEDHLRLNGRL